MYRVHSIARFSTRITPKGSGPKGAASSKKANNTSQLGASKAEPLRPLAAAKAKQVADAAAAASVHTSSTSAAVLGGSPQHASADTLLQGTVELSIDGAVLPPDISILQALATFKSARLSAEAVLAESDAMGSTHSLWHPVHEVAFTVHHTPSGSADPVAASPGTSASTSMLASKVPTRTVPVVLGLNRALLEQWLLEPFRSPEAATSTLADEQALSPTACTLLSLLRILHGIGRSIPMSSLQPLSSASGSSAALPIPVAAFRSNLLTGKLLRQLQDTVSVCANNMPKWLNDSLRVCPFLFPFETRLRFYFSTAFGVHRGLKAMLHGMHQQRDRDSEVRLGRIPRQKVPFLRCTPSFAPAVPITWPLSHLCFALVPIPSLLLCCAAGC
jgi:hypothetical protein